MLLLFSIPCSFIKQFFTNFLCVCANLLSDLQKASKRKVVFKAIFTLHLVYLIIIIIYILLPDDNYWLISHSNSVTGDAYVYRYLYTDGSFIHNNIKLNISIVLLKAVIILAVKLIKVSEVQLVLSNPMYITSLSIYLTLLATTIRQTTT